MRDLAIAAIALALTPAAAAHPRPWAAASPPRPDRRAVPILEYHAIGSVGPGVRELYLRRSSFVAQMRWLAVHRYRAVTLDRVWAAWHGGARLPARPVVLTFDDGYPGDWRVALPVLRRRGWAGVLNLHVGNLTARHVRGLIAAGWEVDAHTVTHPDLTTVSEARLRREVAGSRAWIRRVFGVRAAFFCYPFGRYDARVVREVRRAGFTGAESERYGLARPGRRWTLPRIEITASEGLAGFAAQLRAAR